MQGRFLSVFPRYRRGELAGSIFMPQARPSGWDALANRVDSGRFWLADAARDECRIIQAPYDTPVPVKYSAGHVSRDASTSIRENA
jgi:hypothetical protein